LGKVIILPTGKPGQELRSALLPKRRRSWNWRRALGNLLTTAGLVLVWWVAVMMFCEATGGR
jgi:hypothetical protein